MQVVGFDGELYDIAYCRVPTHHFVGAGIVLFFIMLLQAVGKKQSHKIRQ